MPGGKIRRRIRWIGKGWRRSRVSSADMFHVQRGVLSTVEQQVENAHLMHKATPELGILGVAGVIEPRDFDAGIPKRRLLQIAFCGRSGEVLVSFCLQAEVNQSSG